MTVEAELLELMESVVQVAPSAPRRRDGARVPGEPVGIRGHVEVSNRTVRNQQGVMVVASGRVLCNDAYPWVDEACTLTLPNGKHPLVVAVETTYGINLDTGQNGPYQTVIYYGG